MQATLINIFYIFYLPISGSISEFSTVEGIIIVMFVSLLF